MLCDNLGIDREFIEKNFNKDVPPPPQTFKAEAEAEPTPQAGGKPPSAAPSVEALLRKQFMEYIDKKDKQTEQMIEAFNQQQTAAKEEQAKTNAALLKKIDDIRNEFYDAEEEDGDEEDGEEDEDEDEEKDDAETMPTQ